MSTSVRRRSRLARRYVIVVVGLVAAVVLLNGLVALWFSYRGHRDDLAELQGEKAAAAAATIGGFIEQIDRHVASVTWGDPPLELQNTFRRILFQVPAITELRYIERADGRARYRASS